MKDSLTKSTGDEKQSISNESIRKQPDTTNSDFVDNSTEAIRMRQFQSDVDNNNENKELSDYQDSISKTSKPNKTGIPDDLKASIESLSGYSLDDVKVHYNSDKPAQIGAYAYTEGNNIYIGPGQEEHLAHELWHVIQQKQGNVKPNTELGTGTLANTETSLEDQATRMGDKAKKTEITEERTDLKTATTSGPVQMLSQPNQNIIHAGDDEEDLSSEQQDKQIEALLADAAKALGPFTQVFNQLKVDTRASTKKIDQQKKVKYKADHPKVLDEQDPTKEGDIMYHQHTNRPIMETKNLAATSMGGLKGKERIKQKMNTKYAGAGKNAVNEINDVVRGTLAFENFQEMLFALNKIEELAGSDFGNFSYTIARIKQIYTPLSALLYGDVKLNLNVKSGSDYDGEAFNHNCELQLNTLQMLEGKGTTQGHGAYVKWRDLDEEHWKNEGSALPVKLKDMTDEPLTKYRSRARQAVFSSHDAYRAADIARQRDSHFNEVVEKVKEIGGNTVDVEPQYFSEQTFEQTAESFDANYAKFIKANMKEIENKD
ncbi:DUF4157 domain-containing protein [Aureispira sp. CCB-QB1]|uniref:eCIS core domain-containing protein n=1 Tax=Aureispira sp. CCB-QB1 TaxID=1313421 RepID=UPI0007C73BEB|nr:DUF4157 domain-containing protein [Aureispira sp. CCB-QB1]